MTGRGRLLPLRPEPFSVRPTAVSEGKGTPAGKPSFAAPNSPLVANPHSIRDHSTGRQIIKPLRKR